MIPKDVGQQAKPAWVIIISNQQAKPAWVIIISNQQAKPAWVIIISNRLRWPAGEACVAHIYSSFAAIVLYILDRSNNLLLCNEETICCLV